MAHYKNQVNTKRNSDRIEGKMHMRNTEMS